MVTSVAAFFLEGTATQIVLTMLVSMTFMAVQSGYQPYLEDKDDNLATISQWGLVITLLAGIMFKLQVSAEDGYSDVVYTVLVYISLITPMASAVYEATVELFPHYSLSRLIPKSIISDQMRRRMVARRKTKRPSEIIVNEAGLKQLRVIDAGGDDVADGVDDVDDSEALKRRGEFKI